MGMTKHKLKINKGNKKLPNQNIINHHLTALMDVELVKQKKVCNIFKVFGK